MKQDNRISPPPSPSSVRTWPCMLVLLVGLPALLGAVLPGDFILKQTAALWKADKGLAIERHVVGLDVNAPPSVERLYLKNGRMRLEAHDTVRIFDGSDDPTLPARRRSSSRSGRPGKEQADESLEMRFRPWAIDAPFLRGAASLSALCQQLGIEVSSVALTRIPTHQADLPFVLLYRLGSNQKPGLPFLDIQKDQYLLRRLQFHEGSDGPLWLVEYEGYGSSKELPSWLPLRMTLYRGGMRLESITVVQKLSTPLKDAMFAQGDVP